MTSPSAAPALPRRVPLALSLRAGRILWRMLPWLGAAAVIAVAAIALRASDALRHQAFVVAGALAAYAFLTALLGEILSPNRAALRLTPLSDRQAGRLSWGLRVLLFFLLVTELGSWLVRENDWRPSVAALLAMTRNIVLVLVAAGLFSWTGWLGRMRGARGDGWLPSLARVVGRWIFPLAVFTALFLVVARGLGYAPLARFVSGASAWTALKIAVAFLVFRYLKRLIHRSVRFMGQTAASTEGDGAEDADAAETETSPAALGAEVLASGIVKWATVVAALLWILSGWGLPPSELSARLQTPIFGEGGLTWGRFLGGIAEVGLVLLVGWLIKTVLVFFIFPRSKVDVGARYAILAVLRYIVIAFALIFSLGALGLELGSLGWFFGAAGIGIGLGLQDIIGNFFSGLIMLLERPIRVGDVVQVGADAGTVEDIRMRGTTLRTFDNTTILIPNRQMLGERITNLTYAMGHTRVRLDIGVSYDADPETVKRVLRETADAHAEVLVEPEPAVVFQGYGASSLDFSLFCYTSELRRRVGIASEMRYDLFERLKKAGIEIPFPQTDLHIRSGLK